MINITLCLPIVLCHNPAYSICVLPIARSGSSTLKLYVKYRLLKTLILTLKAAFEFDFRCGNEAKQSDR